MSETTGSPMLEVEGIRSGYHGVTVIKGLDFEVGDEVFFEFLERYGKDRPFDDHTFFDELVEATYPEIGDFFRDHVQGNEPLPYGEYFAKVGVDFVASPPGGGTPGITIATDAAPEQIALRQAWSSRFVD